MSFPRLDAVAETWTDVFGRELGSVRRTIAQPRAGAFVPAHRVDELV